MNEFVDLIQKYLLYEISIDDFFSESGTLRRKLNDEYNTHPMREMELGNMKDFSAGKIDKEEFNRQSEIIRKEIQTYFRSQDSLVPFTPEYELLLSDLVFLIDRLDGDEDVYGGDVLTEETFHQELKKLLDKLLSYI